jgi:hypothetical protein
MLQSVLITRGDDFFTVTVKTISWPFSIDHVEISDEICLILASSLYGRANIGLGLT